ncbi:GNAT family N-acetyltransferase [Nocardia sp. IFM 10818]
MNARLERVRLGPVQLHGCTVVLRPPRFADYAAWRALRLRDRALIEPFWLSSPLAWEERHTAKAWVRECLEAATHARTGRRLATVIEIDGRFAGQVEIGGIDPWARHAEMGIWMDAELARHGFGGLAAALLLDFGFDVLGLERIIAPVSTSNVAAARGAEQVGYVREARMALHFDVGGARVDHDLWAATRADIPPKGFTERWIEHVLTRRSGPIAPTPLGAAEMPGAATILRVGARYRVGQVRRFVQRTLPAPPLTLRLPDFPGVVLRTPRPGDAAAWHAVRRNAGAPGSESQTSARWREFARHTAGVRAPHGLLLVIDVDGAYAGEARLFDHDIFDHNARIHLWADPARADEAVRAAALRTLLDHAFGRLGLRRVTTEIESADTTSAAVAARAGLLKEGTMRDFRGPTGHRADHELWAITSGSDHDA